MKNPELLESYEEMMLYAYYSARRDEIIVDAWNMKVSVPRIAEMMGMGKATVYRVLRAAGIAVGEGR
jgi:hypothetical protein